MVSNAESSSLRAAPWYVIGYEDNPVGASTGAHRTRNRDTTGTRDSNETPCPTREGGRSLNRLRLGMNAVWKGGLASRHDAMRGWQRASSRPREGASLMVE